jgi:hypothetical protein
LNHKGHKGHEEEKRKEAEEEGTRKYPISNTQHPITKEEEKQ